MGKKTISESDVRRIAAELDCCVGTVRKVFKTKEATNRPVSRKVLAILIRDGFLDEVKQ